MSRLAQVMRENGLSVADVSKLTGISKTTVSLVKNGKYQDEAKEDEILKKLEEQGVSTAGIGRTLRVNRDVFVRTSNVDRFFELADELSDPVGDLTSSIGMVIGRAGRGKSFAARRYAVNNENSVYILYVDGFSLVDVAREIAYELSGLKPRFFRACLEAIEDASVTERKLVIIDEADKMPKKTFEMLRSINERCALPMILVGEENLKKILQSERRLKSRVRRIVHFEPVDLVDITAYYKQAVGIVPEGEALKMLHKRCSGDFRLVVRDSFEVVRILNASGLNRINEDVVKGLSNYE